jgi:hypothetical protein
MHEVAFGLLRFIVSYPFVSCPVLEIILKRIEWSGIAVKFCVCFDVM